MNKKGEMQLYETILVLFVFFVILGILLVVFNKYTETSLNNLKYEVDRDNAFNLLKKMPASEYMLYTYFGDSKGVIDGSKLVNIELNNLGLKEILVEEFNEDKIICERNNYPNCNYYIVYSNKPKNVVNKQEMSRPVLIYNPYTKQNNAGKLIIRWY